MATTYKFIDNCDGIKWFELSGIDKGTAFEFNGSEVFGITDDDRILNCDGYPLTPGDIQEIAVRNSIPKIGRPLEMSNGKKVNTYLDAPSIAIATRLGDGNVSEGIRKALRLADD